MADPAIRSEQIEAIRTALPEGWQLVGTHRSTRPQS